MANLIKILKSGYTFKVIKIGLEILTAYNLGSDTEVKESSLLQGTSTEQDTRFSDKEKKLMKQMKFGDCLTQQVGFFSIHFSVKSNIYFGIVCTFVVL